MSPFLLLYYLLLTAELRPPLFPPSIQAAVGNISAPVALTDFLPTIFSHWSLRTATIASIGGPSAAADTASTASSSDSVELGLQDAIERLDYSHLVRQLELAEKARYRGPWVKSAQFISQQLGLLLASQTAQPLLSHNIHAIPATDSPPSASTSRTGSTPASASTLELAVESALMPIQATALQLQVGSIPASSSTQASATYAIPEPPAWWTSPPSDLFLLLPPLSAASSPFPLNESISASGARYDAIVGRLPHQHQPQSFPIVVIAYNRPALLNATLASLLTVQGVEPTMITVYQDGSLPSIGDVAAFHSVRLVQNLLNDVSPEALVFTAPAARISRHYKFSLTHVFRSFADADYAIIVEDDMLFSSDFLLYFSQLVHLYADDPSIYCITSWNDNGQSHLSRDPRVLYRSDFFGGLGWLISRRMYQTEWESQWPAMHWDHWLREEAQRRGRECIYPEVSRNYNVGRLGTHSDDAMYVEYFQYCLVNQQQAVWLGNTNRMIRDRYEETLIHTLTAESLILHPSFHGGLLPTLNRFSASNLVLIYSALNFLDPVWEEYVSVFFGLWHSIPYIRGAHHDLIQFRWKTNRVFLLPTYSRYYELIKNRADVLADGVEPISREHLIQQVQQFRQDSENQPSILLAQQFQACTVACDQKGLKCEQIAIYQLNNCQQMQVTRGYPRTTHQERRRRTRHRHRHRQRARSSYAEFTETGP